MRSMASEDHLMMGALDMPAELPQSRTLGVLRSGDRERRLGRDHLVLKVGTCIDKSTHLW